MKLFLFVLLLPSVAFADALVDVYKKALSKDPTYLAALANNKSSREREVQAKSFMYPNISAQASSRKIDTTSSDHQQNTYTLNLNQPLYNKRTIHGLRQSKHTTANANHVLTQAKQSLMLRVAQAYFDRLQAKDSLEAARSESKAISKQLQNIRQQFDIGTATITDLSEAKARKDAAVFSVLSAETNIKISTEKLREITGEVPGYLRPLKNTIPLLLPTPANADAWVRLANKNSATLHAQKSLQEAAKEEIQIQRAGHFPSLNLTAGVNKSHNDIPGTKSSHDKSVGLQLDIPIFQGGYVKSKVREARHKFTASKHAVSAAKREIQRSIRASYAIIGADIKRIRAAEQLLRSSRTALNAAQEGFDAGTRTSLDVLNARSVMFEAKLSLAQSRYDYLLHILELKAVAGVLQEKDLKKINALLR